MSEPLILMSTYNGAAYLAQQLASIRAQTVDRWRLLVRDDGSSDATREILEQHAREDSRIEVLPPAEVGRLGAVASFGELLRLALERECTVFFLADQDDRWVPHKIERQLRAFPDGGREALPLLVHSDLAVVDEALGPLHPSLCAYMALYPETPCPLPYLLTRNFVTGCALAGNRRLLEEALPVASQAIMHDWWLALAAAATGQLVYLPEALVDYRQHGRNAIGARGFWHGLNPFTDWVAGWRRGNEEYRDTLRQGRALASLGAERGWSPGSMHTIQAFAELPALPTAERLRRARALGLRQGNRLLQLIFYTRLLTVSATDPTRPA